MHMCSNFTILNIYDNNFNKTILIQHILYEYY